MASGSIPKFASKRGRLKPSALPRPSPSVLLNVDEMGPVAAKSYPGQEAIAIQARPAPACQAGDRLRTSRQGVCIWCPCGRRPAPAGPSAIRGASKRISLISSVGWMSRFQRASSVSTRSSTSWITWTCTIARICWLFQIHHPRWEFVYQPKYAAYLNLIEPWWKILRSLALKGRRFETWEEVVESHCRCDRLLDGT